MKILAIETSTLTGSVALVEAENPPSPPLTKGGEGGFRLIGEITLSVSLQHSERLLPAIERLLQDSALPSPLGGRGWPAAGGTGEGGIDLIAVSHGPGSFTGLRVGIATAQGLATAWGKPVIGVSSLAALAMNGAYFDGLVVPLFDARRGEVYAAIRGREQAVAPGGLAEVLANESVPILLLGDGAVTYREIFERRLGSSVRFAECPHNSPRAANVGILALREFQQRVRTPRVLPQYLRPAEATFPRREI